MSYPYQYPSDQYGGYPPPAGQPPPIGYPGASYPPPAGPPPGHPSSGYSQPPYGGYPPPGGQPPPPSGYNPSYGAPPGAPGGYGAPPAPPPPGYPGASPSQYPPPSQYPLPAQYPPAGNQSVPPAPSHPGYHPAYMPPPAGQQGQYAPPHSGGPPPPQGYYPPPGQAPLHGYSETYLGVPVPSPNHPSPPLYGFDAHRVAETLRKAMKGFGTDEKALIETIAPLDALQVDATKKAFEALTGKGLIKEVESEISGYFEYAVRAKLLGPVGFDCWLLERASSGVGTDETLLNEILLDRSNFEVNTLKATFRSMYGKDLTSAIRGELTGKTERLFNMALVGNRDIDAPYLDQAKVQEDVKALYKAGKGKIGTDEVTISSILVTRAPNHLRAVIKAYGDTHGRLSKDIISEFSGHMEDALLYIVKGYEGDGNGIDRDTEKIYKTMEGMGTKDERLITRVMRAHWNQPRFNAIKSRFNAMYGKTLVARIRSEISGEYKEFMAAVAGESSYLQSNFSNVQPSTAPHVVSPVVPTNYLQGSSPTQPLPAQQKPPASQSHSPAPSSAPPSSATPSALSTAPFPPHISLAPHPGYPSEPPPPPHPPGYPTANVSVHQPPMLPGSTSIIYLGVSIPPPPPNPPNLAPLSGFNVDRVYETVRKAMKGFGTDEKALTEAIAPLDAFQIEVLKRTFETKTGKPLIKEVEKEVSGSYQFALRAKLLGPVLFDCWLLYRAWSRSGTDEETFIEILLDRSNIEINTLKQAFKATYNLDIIGVIRAKSDLLFSEKSERMFNMALNQDRDPDGPPAALKLEEDVRKLYEAGEGRKGTDEMMFFIILITRSPSHLRAVAQTYAHTHRRLSSAVKGEFSGVMKHALMHIVLGYEADGYGIERDAELIHETMKGMGTQDERLVTRIIRAHWDRPRFIAIKAAYERKYGESLLARVRKETSGDYKDFMCAIINGPAW